MALHTKLAKKVLTKGEQRHLTEANIHSMSAFKRTREWQREQDRNTGRDTCFECARIARKLGLEDWNMDSILFESRQCPLCKGQAVRDGHSGPGDWYWCEQCQTFTIVEGADFTPNPRTRGDQNSGDR